MPVAIKMIQPNKTSAVSPDRKENFQREVTILSRVKHENIVKVFFFDLSTSLFTCRFYFVCFLIFFRTLFSLPCCLAKMSSLWKIRILQ